MKNSLIVENIAFSILMASYNNGKFIKEAIKSVISQTNPKWELIIVDDCSTDDSVVIIKSFLNENRIKLIQHKKNMGYGGSLKTAADNASNKVIGILDSDDKLHETALEIMSESYRKYPECGFIYSTYWICDSQLKNCVVNNDIGKIIPENKVFFRIRIGHFKTFRKDIFDKTSGFDPTQKRAVDKDLIFKLEEVTKFKFINIPLYYYRYHESGISQGKNKFEAYIFYYIAKYKAYQRRLNTDLPNLTKKDLLIEYHKITFNKMIEFIKFFWNFFRFSRILEVLLIKIPWIPVNFEKKIENLILKLTINKLQ